MFGTRFLIFTAVFASFAGIAAAQSAQGVWRTQADKKGQTALVNSVACGNALCGTITQVMDPSGQRIDHPNVGRKIFWDMKQVSPGVYEGRAFVPAFGAEYAATMKLDNGKMKVGGCLGPVCKTQTWTRVK